VLKDRTDLIDGKTFDDPSFECFEPVVSALNIGGRHFVLDTSRTSDEALASPDFSVEERRRRQKVLAEEIEGILTSDFPGTTRDEKKAKADILQAAFGTRSWTAICQMHPDALKEGRDIVEHLCRAVTQYQLFFFLPICHIRLQSQVPSPLVSSSCKTSGSCFLEQD
jgi:hypothetical protein